MTNKEIAKALGCSLRTVQRRELDDYTVREFKRLIQLKGMDCMDVLRELGMEDRLIDDIVERLRRSNE